VTVGGDLEVALWFAVNRPW